MWNLEIWPTPLADAVIPQKRELNPPNRPGLFFNQNSAQGKTNTAREIILRNRTKTDRNYPRDEPHTTFISIYEYCISLSVYLR